MPTSRPCGGCSGSRPDARAARAGYVLVVHPNGERAHVRADIARRMAAADPGSRTVGTRGDGTLAGAPGEVVYLSGIVGSLGRAIGGVARGAVRVGRTVVGATAGVVGAGVGMAVGGPAGAAIGSQIGGVVGNAVRHRTPDERLARRAQQIAQQAARLGLQLDEPTALWLAGQTDAQVTAWMNQARQRQNASMEANVAAQIASAQAGGMAPVPAPAYGQPVPDYVPTPMPPAPPAGGAASMLGSPLVLGAAALAAVLLLKK